MVRHELPSPEEKKVETPTQPPVEMGEVMANMKTGTGLRAAAVLVRHDDQQVLRLQSRLRRA